MNKELLARFLPRFIETAEGRLATLTELLAHRNDDGVPAKVRGEYHSLAGEASMLGLVEIGNQARAAENAAVQWEGGDTRAMMTCLRTLRTLNKAVAALSAPSQEPAASEGASEAAPREGAFRVLVVDDSAINAETVADALEDEGMEATTAAAMDEIAEALADAAPDLVLTDVNMPGLSLASVVDTIRDQCSAKVYLLSGLSQEELGPLRDEVGADGAVSKSAGLDALVATVKAAATSGAG